jgi:hypothetical protein
VSQRQQYAPRAEFKVQELFRTVEESQQYCHSVFEQLCDGAMTASGHEGVNGTAVCAEAEKVLRSCLQSSGSMVNKPSPTLPGQPSPTQVVIATDRYCPGCTLSMQGIFLEDCTIFDVGAAPLDIVSGAPWPGGGHARFKSVGWLLGGEFAIMQLGAAVSVAVSDGAFVFGTNDWRTTGWRLRGVSGVLNIMHLGVLASTCIVVRANCVSYLEPLGVPIALVRDGVVALGCARRIHPHGFPAARRT